MVYKLDQEYFSSPTQVDINAGSVGASLVVWIVAGLLAWTGASSFAELGATIPLNGSSQAYLRHIYGPIPSFCLPGLLLSF